MVALAAVIVACAVGSTESAEALFFTNSNCGPCHQTLPHIEQLIREGAPIRVIDEQQRPDVAQAYGIREIPCLLVVRGGQIVDRHVGGAQYQELRAFLTRHFQPPTRPQSSVSQVQATSSSTPAVQRAIQASVRLRVEDREGHSFGTGTIIDVHGEEALVLTCGHIFRASQGKGRIVCEFFVPGAEVAEGRLISYDLRRDVALIAVTPRVPLPAAPVGGNGCQPQQGDAVFSVGCNRGGQPSVIENRILAVNRYHGPANFVVGGRPVDGRSGGGLFTADGMLIGVCNAADQQADEGLYAALGPIHAELDRAGLSYIYRDRAAVSLASLPSQPKDIVANGHQFSSSGNSAHGGEAGQGSAGSAVYPAANQTSQASPSRSSTELICIVRNQNGSETDRVIVIQGVSDDLLRQISAEINQRGNHTDTHLQVPHASGPPPRDSLWHSSAATSPVRPLMP